MPKIKEDSAFAEAILTEIVSSPKAVESLIIAATTVRKAVIEPILKKLKDNTALNDEEKNAIKFFAKEHSREGMQWGGALQRYSMQELIETPLLLIDVLDKRLNPANLPPVLTPEILANTMKAITDSSFCYVEYLKSQHTPGFTLVHRGISPTPEELAIRVTREEAGDVAQVAISYGIGTTPGVDIAPKGQVPPPWAERAHTAGKAVFLGADTFERMNVTAKKYDETIGALADIKKAITANYGGDNTALEIKRTGLLATLKKVSTDMIFYKIPLLPEYRDLKKLHLEHVIHNFDKCAKLLNKIETKIAEKPGVDPQLSVEREKCLGNFKKAAEEMTAHKIPLNPAERESDLRNYGARKPTIQKLAEWGGEKDDKLPLVATASGTTARTLIALQDLGAFNNSGAFDSERAQYFSSALCGTIVHGGHHSVLEVAEMYNRLLDHHAIANIDKAPVPAVAERGWIETSMPYYIIGHSSSLLPPEIRDSVVAKQEAIMTQQSVKSSHDFKDRMENIRPPIEVAPPVVVDRNNKSMH